jgi:preprotein translocase subunit SecY
MRKQTNIFTSLQTTFQTWSWIYIYIYVYVCFYIFFIYIYISPQEVPELLAVGGRWPEAKF